MKKYHLLSQVQWKLFACLAMIVVLGCILIPSGLPKVQADSDWLTGWENRVKITVDSANIDANLTHFPLLVHLSDSCGQDSQNMTAIFDEVGANYQKIAVTSDDGETQLYAEVESWNATSEEAWLWVSKSGWTISSSNDTELYLYYDGSHDDNSSYVDIPGGTVSQNVWDSYNGFVTHMADTADHASVLDSTTNNNDCTKVSTSEPAEASGLVGEAQNYDGSNDLCHKDSGVSGIGGQTQITYEALVKRSSTGNAIIFALGNCSTYNHLLIAFSDNKFRADVGNTDAYRVCATNETITDTSWHYLVATYDSGTMHIYVDGEEWDSITVQTLTGAAGTPSTYLGLGMANDWGSWVNPFSGLIDEVRVSNTLRSAAWLKASYNNVNDNLISFSVQGNWLTGWENRVKITVDSANIDANLTHFPLLVHLSDDCGQDGQDLTGIFDEVGSNYQKIAVTSDNAETQLYIEVENWDATNEEAWLWVSSSNWTISSSIDTELYLYYDSTHENNSTYVGVAGSAAGNAVWDSYFIANYHMVDIDDTSYIIDSTSNDHHEAATDPSATTGKIGQAQDFDGTDDVISIPDSSSLSVTGATTFSIWCKTTQGGRGIISKDRAGSTREWIVRPWYNGVPELYLFSSNPANYLIAQGTANLTDGEWHHLVAIWDGVNALNHISFYVDGVADSISWQNLYSSGYTPHDSNLYMEIGRYYCDNTYCFDGLIDEVSMSNTVRSASWVKAFYYSSSDDLITFSYP